MPLYLADSTIWAWARRREPIRAKLAERVARGEVVTCVPIVLEVLHAARSGADYEDELAEIFAPLDWLPLTEAVSLRAFELQRSLAATTHGAHRLPAIDYLIAACALEASQDVVLWHLDRDLGRLCDHAGHPQEAERAASAP